jgi:photosystem II oxygen-evolving enhancer protein 2
MPSFFFYSVDGQDVVFKDIIEPLESVSVSVTSTDKASIDDFGPPEEIASTLATKVLTPASQQVKVLGVTRRVVDGRPYVDFEFAAKAPNYIRHALASVAVANGKFYTLTTGANELRRWSKVKGTLQGVVSSFKVVDRY